MGLIRLTRFQTFQPTGVEPAGEHRLDVRLKGAKGKVRSRRSYYVTPSH